jgi:hypothetical protein
MPTQISMTTGVFQLMNSTPWVYSSVALLGRAIKVAPFPPRVTCFERSLTLLGRSLPCLNVDQIPRAGMANVSGVCVQEAPAST